MALGETIYDYIEDIIVTIDSLGTVHFLSGGGGWWFCMLSFIISS